MRKISLFLSRMVLIFGVLIALTPCGICSAAVGTSSSPVKACCMSHMDGSQGCCHSKKTQEPYCKAMDQASVVPALHGTVLTAKPSVVAAAVQTLVSFRVCVIPSAVVSSSPPRGNLALRI
jgi:hypothetical protein